MVFERLKSGPQGPLAGRRVLELCTTIAGPACARLLADYGADVIKVEALDGDPVRQMASHEGDVSLYAASILRNKRSIAVDLKQPEGVRIARALSKQSDVVVENFRPGTLEKLGLGYDVLAAENPKLVLVRISGYGQDGPNRHKPGYGVICEAYGGLRHVTGDPDRPPPRAAVALTDYLGALYAAYGTALALIEADRTGLGQVVDVSLFEAAFSLLEPDVPAYDRLGIVAGRHGSRLQNLAPNNLYRAGDGTDVLIAANNDVIFRRLCTVMGAPALADDPRYSTIRARGERVAQLDDIVGAWVRSRDSGTVVSELENAAVPCSKIYTIADAFADPHYQARGAIERHSHPDLGSVAMTGLVVKLSATPGAVHSVGPDIGAQTDEILSSDLGLDAERISHLKRAGVVGAATAVEAVR